MCLLTHVQATSTWMQPPYRAEQSAGGIAITCCHFGMQACFLVLQAQPAPALHSLSPILPGCRWFQDQLKNC